MDNPSQTTLLKTGILLPIEGPPIINGALLLKEGRIEACLSKKEIAALEENPTISVYDFSDSIILPGLINLHTHLEYSLLKGHNASAKFFPWIKSLQAETRNWEQDTWLYSADLGARAARAAGTTCVVDNSYAGVSAQAIAQVGLRAVVGLEVFGVNQETAPTQWASWLEKRAKLVAGASPLLKALLSNKTIRLTVATHAPYTVCPALWFLAKQWAADNGETVLCHAAETENERRWFASDDEEIDALLTYSFGRIPAYKGDPVLSAKVWRKGAQSPIEHLDCYSLLDDKLLVAHAVKITETDAAILAKRGVSIAHCPRSNSRLRNGVAPIDLFYRHQLQFGLGTDSLASGDDLDLLAEARFAVGVHRALNPESTFNARQALEAITLGAARAIHMDTEIGSLSPGKRADLAVFSFSEGGQASDLANKRDPYELLVHGQCKLNSLFVDGHQVLGVPVKSVPSRTASAKV
jgi:5-methylthioadenosine/S-adenosylhomocysteine deaminase